MQDSVLCHVPGKEVVLGPKCSPNHFSSTVGPTLSYLEILAPYIK